VRRELATIAAKAAGQVSRNLGIGGGTALPGLIAEGIDPGIVTDMSSCLGQGSVLVTGTNGKTTTARLIRRVVNKVGLVAIGNREGSNMMRGIAASLAEAAGWQGTIPDAERSMGVFEVDEATLPKVAQVIGPRVVLFTNLFRDQLDRYGEVETVARLWQDAVAAWDNRSTIVLNADDPSVASLQGTASGKVLTFGIDDASLTVGEVEHASDARWCRTCGAELAYSTVFYGHLGHWSCSKCQNRRRAPDVSCSRLVLDRDDMQMTVTTPSGQFEVSLSLTGVYNSYNALAATATAIALGIAPDVTMEGLSGFTAAFGRQERMLIGDREVEVILAKNPAGLNQVLNTLVRAGEPMDVIFLLNDDIADGRDISWIWDVDFEMLQGRLRSLSVSGHRSWDMALRLKYAGLSDSPGVNSDTKTALRHALAGTAPGGRLYVIPTYTAMLEARNVLGKWAGKGAFWEGDGG